MRLDDLPDDVLLNVYGRLAASDRKHLKETCCTELPWGFRDDLDFVLEKRLPQQAPNTGWVTLPIAGTRKTYTILRTDSTCCGLCTVRLEDPGVYSNTTWQVLGSRPFVARDFSEETNRPGYEWAAHWAEPRAERNYGMFREARLVGRTLEQLVAERASTIVP